MALMPMPARGSFYIPMSVVGIANLRCANLMGTKDNLMDVLLYIPLIVRLRVRVFSYGFVRGLLWKNYPLDQEDTDLAFRLVS